MERALLANPDYYRLIRS